METQLKTVIEGKLARFRVRVRLDSEARAFASVLEVPLIRVKGFARPRLDLLIALINRSLSHRRSRVSDLKLRCAFDERTARVLFFGWIPFSELGDPGALRNLLRDPARAADHFFPALFAVAHGGGDPRRALMSLAGITRLCGESTA